MAFQGDIDLYRQKYDGLTLGLLDDQGCAIMTQKISGPLKKPNVAGIGLIETLTGPVIGTLQKAIEILNTDDCSPFYTGRLTSPDRSNSK